MKTNCIHFSVRGFYFINAALGLITFLHGPLDALALSIDEMNAKINSGDIPLDYTIQDVCVDSADNIIAGDPAVCSKHRNVRIGEKVPYLLTDLDPSNGATYQANWSYPVPGTDGTLKVIVPKNLSSSFSHSFRFDFVSGRDAYDLMDTTGDYYSYTRTYDGGCFDQIISTSSSKRTNGWTLFPINGGDGNSVHSTSLTRITTNVNCLSVATSAQTNDIWNSPVDVIYDTGKKLSSIITYHFADTNLSQANNALERFFFTKEYGLIRWEAWIPLAQCQDPNNPTSPAANGNPQICTPNTSTFSSNMGRCNDKNIPAVASWGNQTWIRLMCRDTTNYISLDTPLIPLDTVMGRTNGVLDIDSAALFSYVPNHKSDLVIKAPPPVGSYSQSCKSCSMAGSALSCSCVGKNGSLQSSTLDTNSCDASGVWNKNGALTCNAANTAPSPDNSSVNLPTGTYSNSCNGCSMNGSTIACSCANKQGHYQSTSLDTKTCSSTEVWNNDGALRCISEKSVPVPTPPSTLPAGSYSQSCNACSLSGSMLSCSCKTKSGTSIFTTINSANCGTSGISNQNGELTCVNSSGTSSAPKLPTAFNVGFNETFLAGYAQIKGLTVPEKNTPPITLATIQAYLASLAKNNVHAFRDVMDMSVMNDPSFNQSAVEVVKAYQAQNFNVIFTYGGVNPYAPAGSVYNCFIPGDDAIWDQMSTKMANSVAQFFAFLKTQPSIDQNWVSSHVLVEPWNEFDSVGVMNGTDCISGKGTPKHAAVLYNKYVAALAAKNVNVEVIAPSLAGVYFGALSTSSQGMPVFAGWLNDYYAQGGSGRPNVHIYYGGRGPLDGNSVSNWVASTFANLFVGVPAKYNANAILGETGATVLGDGGCSATDAMTDSEKGIAYSNLINDSRINTHASILSFWRLLPVSDVPPCHYGSVVSSAGLGSIPTYNASGQAVLNALK